MNNVKRTSKLSSLEKNRIIVYHEDNMCVNEIAKKIGLHRNTVSKWISRYDEYGRVGLNRNEGTGKIKNNKNSDNEIAIINVLLSNKYMSLCELKELLKDNKNIDISTYKLRNIMKSHGFIYGLPPKRVPLTEEIKYKRLMFAIKYKNIDWNAVIFSDECSIWEGLKTLKRWFNINLGFDYDVTFKHSKKLNIWGAVSASGIKSIHIFSENMNADKYVSILKENFLSIYNSDLYFQFDNDPKHTSSKAKTFLTKNSIKYLDFPPYSPDLNPLENIWSILKYNITKRKGEIKRDNFKNVIIEEWNNISDDVIKKIIGSMNKRLNEIIKNRGNYLDY